MAFLQVKSNNPDLSFILKKNPQSPMLIKQLKKGTVFGYYSKGVLDTYNIFFRDNGDESSFSKDFSYLNSSQFSSSEFVLNAINMFLSHNLKNQDPKDTSGFNHSITINSLEIRSLKFVDFLEKYFPKTKFEFEEINPKHITLKLSSNESLHHLINSLSLVIVFNLFNKFDFLDESLLEKYVNCINTIDAPYFIRYLFKRFLTPKKFKSLKESLEESPTQNIELTFGNNMDSRKRFVSDNLSFSRPLVDLGCGEGAYLTLSRKVSTYFAIDTNPDELEKSKKWASKKELDNITFLNNLEELPDAESFDLIFIEVMEHMAEFEATSLVKKITSLPGLNTLLITTPNSDFNKNYALDGFRHDDHDFEMTAQEFEKFCADNFSDLNYEIFQIGDKVDSIAPTQGVKVWK